MSAIVNTAPATGGNTAPATVTPLSFSELRELSRTPDHAPAIGGYFGELQDADAMASFTRKECAPLPYALAIVSIALRMAMTGDDTRLTALEAITGKGAKFARSSTALAFIRKDVRKGKRPTFASVDKCAEWAAAMLVQVLECLTPEPSAPKAPATNWKALAESLQAQCDALTAERDAAMTERAAALAELATLKASIQNPVMA